MNDKTWTVPINSDGIVSFPEELIKAMEWDKDTILVWDVRDDGSISLRALNEGGQCKASPE